MSGFDKSKKDIINALLNEIDKSPKGSVDLPIRELIRKINELHDFVTTSSCSGRIVLFTPNYSDVQKGGTWLVSSHELVKQEDIKQALFTDLPKLISECESKDVLTTFKLEPFVMHVLCRTPKHAQEMLALAIEAGFRESGMSIGNNAIDENISASGNKVILFIRTVSNRLELPAAIGGNILITEEYLAEVVKLANQRFLDNENRIKKFEELIEAKLNKENHVNTSFSSSTVAASNDSSSLLLTSSDKLAHELPKQIEFESDASLIVPALCGHLVKISLKTLGYLNVKKFVGKHPEYPGSVAIPLFNFPSAECDSKEKLYQLVIENLKSQTPYPEKVIQILQPSVSTSASASSDGSNELDVFIITSFATPIKLRKEAERTHTDLIQLVNSFAQRIFQDDAPEDAIKTVPKRPIEKVSDVAILSPDDFSDPYFNKLDEAGSKLNLYFWRSIADFFTAKRLIRSARIHTGPRRSSCATLIYPTVSCLPYPENPSCWIEIKQHGIFFQLDLLESMFASGNVNERHRIGRLIEKTTKNIEGKIHIVDMFAGIGYFTLPMLVHGGDNVFVHACEWNPASLRALRSNLKRNNVEGRCIVYPGDCRLSIAKFEGKADHVSLGLLPTSVDFIPDGVRALNAHRGGVLHIHANIPEEEEEKFKGDMVSAVEDALSKLQRSQLKFQVICENLERVKTYAPRIWHVVADIRVERVKQTIGNGNIDDNFISNAAMGLVSIFTSPFSSTSTSNAGKVPIDLNAFDIYHFDEISKKINVVNDRIYPLKVLFHGNSVPDVIQELFEHPDEIMRSSFSVLTLKDYLLGKKYIWSGSKNHAIIFFGDVRNHKLSVDIRCSKLGDLTKSITFDKKCLAFIPMGFYCEFTSYQEYVTSSNQAVLIVSWNAINDELIEVLESAESLIIRSHDTKNGASANGYVLPLRSKKYLHDMQLSN